MDQTYFRIPAAGQPAAGAAAARRHDIYGLVHMGLRALMGESLSAVGRMDTDDARDVTETMARLNALLALLRSHLHHENQFILPALEARRPGAGEWNARDHAQHLEAIEMLETYARLVQAGAGATREDAAARLYRKLALFVAENLVHMHAEETENNAVLWATCSDAELAGIERGLVGSMSQHKLVEFLRCMVPALPPAERARLLEDMRRSAPAGVFAAVLAAVRPRLRERDRLKLDAALDLRPVAAEAA